ncbi:MAG: response regulator, partial [Bacteroidota bacterium]
MKQTTSDDSRDVLLIVDDEEQVVLLLSTILSQDGYRCETARDGREAKRILTRSPGDFSTVILDWAMPEMSGIEVLGWMKGEPDLRDLPVIMHSGLINPDHIREGIDAGAFYYLTKPSSHTVLRSVVRAAIVEHNERESLKRKLKDCENPFRYVEEATFRIRTVTDAEFLALRLANASANPEDAIHVAELLNNAIEHGNLKISYDEKTALVEQ